MSKRDLKLVILSIFTIGIVVTTGSLFVNEVDHELTFQSLNVIIPRHQLAQLTSASDGLVARYTFDEGSGLTTADLTGLNSAGILNGDVSWTDGRQGGGLQFGGNSSYVHVATTTAIAGLNQFSVSLWIRPGSGGNANEQVLVERGDMYHILGTFTLTYLPKSLTFRLAADDSGKVANILSPIIWNASGWHHLVVSVSNNMATLYVDGLTQAGVTLNGLSPLMNGKGGSNDYYAMNFGATQQAAPAYVNFFAGSMDDIRIYNRPLTEQEVHTLYGYNPYGNVSVSASNTPWPKFFGQVGGYDVYPSDLETFGSSGFTLAMMGYVSSMSTTSIFSKSINKYGIREIVGVTSKLYKICSSYMSAGQPCPLTSTDEQAIVDDALSGIKSSITDPQVIGYWILDDYPNADIRGVLQRIHDGLTELNKTASFPKATVCGFSGGRLDYKLTPSATFYSSSIGYFVTSLKDYNPTACDIVAIYPYAVASANDPAMIDWSMKYSLPQILAGFRSRGWDQSHSPMIALPHAFSWDRKDGTFYVLPRSSDIATQMESYCKAGIIGFIPFAWNTHAGDQTMASSPAILQGVQQGANICKNQYWNSSVTSIPTNPNPVVPYQPPAQPQPPPQNPVVPNPTPSDSKVTFVGKPIFSGILVSGIDSTSATIGWNTDRPSTSQVSYGLTTSYGSNTVLDQENRVYHVVKLSSLSPNTTYNYKMTSVDPSGNTAESDNYTFTTLAGNVVTPPVTVNTPLVVNQPVVNTPQAPVYTKPTVYKPAPTPRVAVRKTVVKINSVATANDFDVFLMLVKALVGNLGSLRN